MRAMLLALLTIGVCECRAESPAGDIASVKKTLKPAQLAVGDPIVNSIGMVLVPIPAGEFVMSDEVGQAFANWKLKRGHFSNISEKKYYLKASAQWPSARVRLTKPFYLGVTEVTQAQWKAVMGTTPWKTSWFSIRTEVETGDDYPATYVSWYDAVRDFCTRLSAMEGREYRLPTEAEWEYACRAGTDAGRNFDLGEHFRKFDTVWRNPASRSRTREHRALHLVGQRQPNSWGLYDMDGNVAEWCQDWLGKPPRGMVTNPVTNSLGRRGSVSAGPVGLLSRGSSGKYGARSVRSGLGLAFGSLGGVSDSYGFWQIDPACELAAPGRRRGIPPSYGSYHLGFRVVYSFQSRRTRNTRTTAGSDSVSISAKELGTPKTAVVRSPKTRLTPDQLAVGDPIVNSVGMLLLPISAGEFDMDSVSERWPDRSGKRLTKGPSSGFEPRHRVQLTKSFYMGATEVTQGQWKSVMETTPWKYQRGVRDRDDHPAVYVGWYDAVRFCQKLSAQEGVTYRLPTEAEWEYACRAGTKTRYSFGDDTSLADDFMVRPKRGTSIFSSGIAGENYVQIVGQKKPNPWGLYDMHGNVVEWCQDWYGGFSSEATTNPTGPVEGETRVIRGMQSAIRYHRRPGLRAQCVGFRVLRSSAK